MAEFTERGNFVDRVSRAQRSAIMAKIGQKNTKPEIIVRKKLHELGFGYRLHSKSLPGNPDIVLTKHKTVIFVHGCFWHGHVCKKGQSLPKSNAEFWKKKLADNKARDLQDKLNLENLGWKVLTIWECETKCTLKLTEIISKNLPVREAIEQ